MAEFEWDGKASEVFTQYHMDRLAKLEKDDPDRDVQTIDELR